MSTMMRIGLAAAAVVVTLGITQAVRDQNPAGAGELDGKPFRMPAEKAAPAARQLPLRVDSFVVQRVAQGSAWGAAGDLLITFRGQGFMLTSRAPRVLLTDKDVLEATEINRDGTELYVLVPRAQIARVQGLRFDSVVVANPGAIQTGEFARASARASPAQLTSPARDAATVRLVYRDGAFSREPRQ